MITDEDSQSESELLEEVSELLENVYICMSHSEELTLPLIRSGEFVNRSDFSPYIWKKLIEIKKSVEHLKRSGLDNIPKYIQSTHPDDAYSKYIPKKIERAGRSFTIISQSINPFSKVWNSGIYTYLLSSDLMEKVIVLREKINNPDKVKPKTWQSLIITGNFKYYVGYNRLKLLAYHDTSLIEGEIKKNWWELRYLDYNIQDVNQITNTTAFHYLTIDPNDEKLSFFFTTVGKIIGYKDEGAFTALEISDFYKSSNFIYFDNEAFLKALKLLPSEFINKKRGSFFVFLCKANLTHFTIGFDAKEIDFDTYKERGFEALLRYRKVLKRKRFDLESKSPFVGYRADKIYYIPGLFSNEKEKFMDYIEKKVQGLDLIKIMPELPNLRYYFDIFPDYLKLYRREADFGLLNPILYKELLEEQRAVRKARPLPQTEFFFYLPIRLYDGYPEKIIDFIKKITEIISKGITFRIHVILDSRENVKLADDFVMKLNIVKYPKEGKFIWETNYAVGTIRRVIYKYIYKNKPLVERNAA